MIGVLTRPDTVAGWTTPYFVVVKRVVCFVLSFKFITYLIVAADLLVDRLILTKIRRLSSRYDISCGH